MMPRKIVPTKAKLIKLIHALQDGPATPAELILATGFCETSLRAWIKEFLNAGLIRRAAITPSTRRTQLTYNGGSTKQGGGIRASKWIWKEQHND